MKNKKEIGSGIKFLLFFAITFSFLAFMFSLFQVQAQEDIYYKANIINLEGEKSYSFVNLFEKNIVKNITCTEEVQFRVNLDYYSRYSIGSMYVPQGEKGMCVFITKEIKHNYLVSWRWVKHE